MGWGGEGTERGGGGGGGGRESRVADDQPHRGGENSGGIIDVQLYNYINYL